MFWNVQHKCLPVSHSGSPRAGRVHGGRRPGRLAAGARPRHRWRRRPALSVSKPLALEPSVCTARRSPTGRHAGRLDRPLLRAAGADLELPCGHARWPRGWRRRHEGQVLLADRCARPRPPEAMRWYLSVGASFLNGNPRYGRLTSLALPPSRPTKHDRASPTRRTGERCSRTPWMKIRASLTVEMVGDLRPNVEGARAGYRFPVKG